MEKNLKNQTKVFAFKCKEGERGKTLESVFGVEAEERN
jgi:hypothetical protein